MAYTKESLQGKSLGDLRNIAKTVGISPVGKNIADLMREIVKTGKGGEEGKAKANGSSTNGAAAAAPKKRGRPAKVKDEEPEEDEAEEVSTASSEVLEIKEMVGQVLSELPELRSVVVALAKAVGEEGLLPAAWKKEAPKAAKKAPPKETPKPEKKQAKKAPVEEEDEDDETEEESEETVFSPEDLAEMDTAELKKLAARINSDEDLMEMSGGKKISVDTSSARELRQRIITFMEKYASEEGEDDDDKKDEDEDEDEDEE